MTSQAPAATRSEVDIAAARQTEGWGLAAGCLAAVLVLGLTLELSEGMQAAYLGLFRSLLLIMGAIAASRLGRWTPRAEAVLAVFLGYVLVRQLEAMTLTVPGMYMRLQGQWPLAPFYTRLVTEALIAGALLAGPERLRRWLIPALLVVHFSLGAWMLRVSPAPYIDVFVFEVQGAEALLQGQNPYNITFPNIYGNGAFYGEGLAANGRLLFGFPYPPLTLYLTTLGHVLGGDPRYAQLMAMTLAAGLMAYARGGRLGAGAAALLLLTSRGLFVLEQAWTEPLLVLGLAATVFTACRFPRALPYVFGLLLAVKQYTVFMLPLVLLLTHLRGRQLWGLLWRAGATALAVSLPFIVINVPAFVRSVVTLQFHQPFRADALSFLAWWVSRGNPQPPVWIAFASVAVAIALVLWRVPRTPAGFAAGVALVYAVFFAFNKQAFTNYYYFVVGALCVAIAARQPAEEAPVPGAQARLERGEQLEGASAGS